MPSTNFVEQKVILIIFFKIILAKQI